MQPLVVINVAGLTPALAQHAPNLRALGPVKPLTGVFPAVTMSAQASLLTGAYPSEHGIPGNAWFERGFGEVRCWPQSNALLQRPPLYHVAKERDAKFTCAKMFWWFNQGSDCDWSVTPKPHYGADGSKEFDIQSNPPELAAELKLECGEFPFFSFWGPRAGMPSSEWIARASAKVIREKRPTLTLVYLPHLDYDLQRFGAACSHAQGLVAQVDACAKHVLDASREVGARVIALSEYGISDVKYPVYINTVLRRAGHLRVRPGPFGEMLDTFESAAFAVCDHQIAHVYARGPQKIAPLLRETQGVASVLDRKQQEAFGIAHERAGDLVLLANPEAWFAYPYWLDDSKAPDFARTVDIHRKLGYDPCELFVDPKISAPKLKAATKVLRKKLGMRYLMDLIPLDASIVKGSHGLLAADPEHGPCIIGENTPGRMVDFKDWALGAMQL
jgi:predicted AlkP superfamily pyrophosphatase or phosphodiesterase